MVKRFLLFGDNIGLVQLVPHFQKLNVVALVGASNRPQYHKELSEIAQSNQLPFIQQPIYTDQVGRQKFLNSIKEYQPERILVNSYSQIIPEEVLNLVKGEAYNIHWALLPKNRGAHPISWALIKGETETGVTLHIIKEGYDTGPIISQIALKIEDQDTWQSLSQKLYLLSTNFLDQSVDLLLKENVPSKPQDESKATQNRRIPKDGYKVDLKTMSDGEIYRILRSVHTPMGGIFWEDNSGQIMHQRELLNLDMIRKIKEGYK